MKKIKFNKIFWLILVVGFIFRVYQLGQLPSILNRDEAALAYNAYLLMETGQDEWQRSWPLALESFGDYKLPGYPLLIIPFFKIFGLHDWVVRLPSMLAGMALLPLGYLLTKRLYIGSKKLKEKAALLVMFLLSISPIMIFYARTGYEANVGLAFLVSTILLIFSIKDKPTILKNIGLFLAALFGVFTYNTPLLLLPFLIIFLLIIYPLKKPKKWLAPLLLISLVAGAGAMALFSLATQKSGITIFSDETIWSNWTQFRLSLPSVLISTIGSKYVYFLMIMIKNFFLSFSPKFLVTNGGAHPWHSLPTMGHVFGSVYVLSLLGFITTLLKAIQNLFKEKLGKALQSKSFLLLYFIIISLAPAIATVDAPHATRSLLFFVLLHILAVIGLVKIIDVFKAKKIIFKIFMIVVCLEGLLHAHRYFTLYPNNQFIFLDGYEEAVQEFNNKYKNEEVAAIVDPVGSQYILTAWYLKLSPEEYHSTINRQDADKIGFKYGDRLLNFHFIAQLNDLDDQEKAVLYWDELSNQWLIKYRN